MITEKEKKELQDFLKQMLTLMADLNDLEKTFSRIRNEATKLCEKINNKLGD